MVTRAQKIRVIVFVSIVAALFLYTIFSLVGTRVFSRYDTYYIRLNKQSVAGLDVGQDVRYYGINIGKIANIRINRTNISQILVTINVRHGTPLKKGVKASLNFIGITGLKIIELTGGENSDEDLPPGSNIEADPGILSDISGKARVISDKVEIMLNNLIALTDPKGGANLMLMIEDIRRSLGNLNNLVKNINSIFVDNKQNIDNMLANAGKLIETAQRAVFHMDKTFLQGRRNLIKSIDLLKETLGNINEFSVMLRDNPDILLKGRSRD